MCVESLVLRAAGMSLFTTSQHPTTDTFFRNEVSARTDKKLEGLAGWDNKFIGIGKKNPARSLCVL